MTTKEKILTEALNLFSVRGYDPVSVRDIASAVGIKESSLYNHFKNKQDIFDTLLQEYSARWDAVFNNLQLTNENSEFNVDDRTVEMYRKMTREHFMQIAETIFDYYMTDDVNVKFRRMLTIEQFRNEEIQKLFRRIAFDDSIDYQARLFKALMDMGHFKRTDPYILALEFFSPAFLIFYKFSGDEENYGKAKELFLRHIDHFNATYGAG